MKNLYLSIVSDSMRPTLAPFDAVEVERCEARDLRRGDLVVFRRGKVFVCHRFLGLARDGSLKTQGDNLWHPDAPVKAKSLVGRVARTLRPDGRTMRAGNVSRWKGLSRLALRRAKWRADRLIRKRACRDESAGA